MEGAARNFLQLAFLLAFAGGCVAHEANGDKAAAIGDWKTAYSEYRLAVERDPGSPELRAKFQQARLEAAARAFKKALACEAMRDWRCASGEAQYALSIDDSNPEVAALILRANKGYATQRIDEGKADLASGRFESAFAAAEHAARLTDDIELREQARRILAEAGAQAGAEADRQRAAKQYQRALALYDLALRVDPSRREARDATQREYDEFLNAEYERLARLGDEAMTQRRWADAEAHYKAALAFRSGGRAEQATKYAGSLGRADARIATRDWKGAAKSLHGAIESGQDHDGYAARLLDQVEVRPYSFRIKSVLVKPTRPDGQAWVGPPNPFLGTLMKMAVHAALPGFGGAIAGAAIDASQKVPPENQPLLRVEIYLPDGRTLLSDERKALYVAYQADFVLPSNRFDDRRVSIKVVGSNHDVGAVEFALRDLLEHGQMTLADQSIAGIELVAERADSASPGVFSNLHSANEESNLAPQTPAPSRDAVPYRLVRASTTVQPGDYQDEFNMDGPPDLQLTLSAGGHAVFVSPKAQDQYSASFELRGTIIYAATSDTLSLSVVDVDVSEHDQVFGASFSGADLARGNIAYRTQRGSFVSLDFERWEPPGP